MNAPSTSNANSAAPSKPKIDPLQLLKCLSILLNPKGGIRGKLEVPRIEGLMAKYSKKLVSKCIYLNILEATDVSLLDAFYDEGGWELVGDWLQDAVNANNWPLAGQVLNLLDASPMTITRLKRYTTPKLIKELSKECKSPDVQSLSKHILVKWMDIVRENDSLGSAAGVGLSNVVVSNDNLTPMEVDTLDGKSSGGTLSNGGQSGSVSAGQGNADSSQECGDGSSSLEGQDDSSNGSTESDVPPAPTTPIRITIRSGSQVLAKVSNQRYSLDSNDSDDNKPLSLLKKEVQKGKTKKSRGPKATSAAKTASEKSHIPPVSNQMSSEANTSDAVAPTNTAVSVSSNSSLVTVSDSSSPENSSCAITTSTATPTILTFTTTTGSLSTSASPPLPQETACAMETDSEMGKTETVNDKEVKSDNEEKAPETSDKIVDEENKEDATDSNIEKEQKSNKEKSKEKDRGKDKDGEKKDKKERDKDRDRDKEREKDKKHRDDKKREKERDSSKSSKISSSSKSRESRNSKDSDRSDRSKSDKERSSSSHSKNSKDKDRSKSSSKDKDRKSSSSRDKSRDKDDKHDEKKKKEQENEDKATLEKVKPLSADGLGKIPRKSQSSSFLDALGSADLDCEAKKPSVKTYKSRGFRNTGLLDEPTKPPAKKPSGNGTLEKKVGAGTGAQGVKRPSPLDELVASLPEKRIKSSVSSMPNTSDKPGGVKLISPKRPSLSDDGGFMAALTASGPDRKKVTRKRRSSESDPKDPKTEGTDEEKSPNSSPVKGDDKGMLSPTNVKPTFNFYQETLKDDTEKDEKEKEGEENEEKENGENGDVEMKEEGNNKTSEEDDNMEIEESEDQGSIQIGIGGDAYGFGTNGNGAGLKDEDIPIAPAAPAPAQEDYEKVEVTFSDPNPSEVRGVLVYHRPENRTKKSVKWKAEEDIKQIFYFEMDETERVNVNNKFVEMMALEKQSERECMGKNRDMHRMMMNPMGPGMAPGQQSVIEYMRWSLLSITVPNQSKVVPGYNSQERKIQAARESSTIPAFYHPAMLPDTPKEPDPEMVTRVEPKVIPLTDVTGQDLVYDHRGKMWPEPMYGEPPVSYGFGGMGGGPPPPPLPPSSVSEGGSHWVVGGPPSGSYPGPGPAVPPMYNGPGGYGGPGMGGPGMGGPGGYAGDMGGGMDMQPGWGGPPPGPGPGQGPGLGPGPGMPYPNQDMMMGGNNHGMMMGGGPGGGGRPGGSRGMMPNMGMGGGQNYRGGRGGPGGSWGPGPSNYNKTPLCKHFSNGHCRHGKNCRFLHSRH